MAFDFDAFEGPGGIGEHRLLGTLEGLDATTRRHLSGTYQANETFEFAWIPDRAEWTAWETTRSSSVSLLVAPPGDGKLLRLSFWFPTEPAKSTLKCLPGSP